MLQLFAVAALRQSLEAQLQERWDGDTLAVYGDHLQSVGDPRGELISIDRQIRSTGLTRALAGRRREVLRAWLGAETIGGRPWAPGWFRDGFIELEVVERQSLQMPGILDALLASPAGPYLRILRLTSSAEGAVHALELLGRARHPWLARLELTTNGPGPVEPSSASAFFGATPALRTLRWNGRGLRSFPHPALRRLELHGRATSALRGPISVELLESGLPDLTELRLELEHPDDLRAWRHLLGPRQLPALRRLDLSAHEAAYHPSEAAGPACELVDSIAERDRITHLRLPSLRSARDAARVRRLLAAMPGLVELSFGRCYACFEAFHAEAFHAGLDGPAIASPPPRPWRPEEQPRGSLARIAFDDGARFELPYASCLPLLERDFDELAAPVQRAWCELWPVVAALETAAETSRGVRFPAQVLARAMQALLLEIRPSIAMRWQEAAESIHDRRIGPDETVELRWELDPRRKRSNKRMSFPPTKKASP